MSEYPQEVTTARLLLRRPGEHDLDAFVSIWGEPAVWQALRPGVPFDLEYARARFERHLAHWEEQGFGLWFIGDRESGDTAGWTGPTHPDFVPGLEREIEVGWVLHPAFWGRGLATEAAQAVVDAALTHLRPPRLISWIEPRNNASAAVAARLGMREVERVQSKELGLDLRVYALEQQVDN
jgi:RimJ/RimL family protein N-acetyltransferase